MGITIKRSPATLAVFGAGVVGVVLLITVPLAIYAGRPKPPRAKPTTAKVGRVRL
jgi:hypothetical protein